MKTAVGKDVELGEKEVVRLEVVEAVGGEHYRKSMGNWINETKIWGENRARDL